jgi:hypothetical protein
MERPLPKGPTVRATERATSVSRSIRVLGAPDQGAEYGVDQRERGQHRPSPLEFRVQHVQVEGVDRRESATEEHVLEVRVLGPDGGIEG